MKNRLTLFVCAILFIFGDLHSQTIDTLIDISNHSLHFEIIKGSGTPILFEAGNGDDGSVWNPILQEIHRATGTTLITYDRAGLGKSGIDTTQISFKRELKNLSKSLKRLGYKKEFFLVAHSFGSFYASEFAQRKKGKVKGAVFIDVATPCMTTRKWASDYKNDLPNQAWPMLKEHREGLYYVLQNFPTIADYMSQRFISNDIPLTLIVAETLPNANTLKTEEDRKNWVRCLKEFGSLPNHTYVLAKNADHKVWEKSPDLIIAEISKLYFKVK